jgi:hypothetical protein
MELCPLTSALALLTMSCVMSDATILLSPALYYLKCSRIKMILLFRCCPNIFLNQSSSVVGHVAPSLLALLMSVILPTCINFKNLTMDTSMSDRSTSSFNTCHSSSHGLKLATTFKETHFNNIIKVVLSRACIYLCKTLFCTVDNYL